MDHEQSSGAGGDGASAADLRAVVHRLLAPRDVGSLVELGRGTDHVAYLVDDDLVARRALEPDPAARAAAARREIALAALTAEISTLPTPEVVAADVEAGIVVSRRLRGTSLLDRPVAAPDRLAPALGAFLDRLHATPVHRVAGVLEEDAHPLSAYREEAVAHHREVADAIPAASRPAVEAFLAAAPPPGPQRLAVCHADLGAEHLLADPVTSELSGVLDWSDAAISDPAVDVGRLLRDLGPAVVDAALERYGPPWDDDDRARAVFHARCALLEDLVHGLTSGDRRYAEAALAALPRTFAAT